MNKTQAQWADLKIQDVFKRGRSGASQVLQQAIADIGELAGAIGNRNDVVGKMAQRHLLQTDMIAMLCQLTRELLGAVGETLAASGVALPENIVRAKASITKVERACTACVETENRETEDVGSDDRRSSLN